MNEHIARKSLGQHWLTDNNSLEAMCESAGVATGDEILEIGPGRGSLTACLLARGAKVTAVELDESLANELNKKFKDQPFILNMLSILDFDFSKLPKDYKIVANIPYYLTNHLLRHLSETANKPSVAALLVQKEVAERVTAQQGKLSILAVVMQLNYEVSLGQVIPAHLFDPVPKVDSQILILKKRHKPLYEKLDSEKYYRLVKAGFSEKRKKLRSSISGGLGISKEEAEEMLEKAEIDPNKRAQELSLDDWHKLYLTC